MSQTSRRLCKDKEGGAARLKRLLHEPCLKKQQLIHVRNRRESVERAQMSAGCFINRWQSAVRSLFKPPDMSHMIRSHIIPLKPFTFVMSQSGLTSPASCRQPRPTDHTTLRSSNIKLEAHAEKHISVCRRTLIISFVTFHQPCTVSVM